MSTKPDSIIFIADLHLSTQTPILFEAFRQFINGPAKNVNQLYILGDLFEYWIGDDAPVEPSNQVAKLLLDLAKQGVQIYFMAGNRDFLIGTHYAQQAGFSILEDPYLLKTPQQNFLLSHGDIFCTDDQEYQAFRRQVRQASWKESILATPPQQRIQLAQTFRSYSKQAGQSKLADIMDVNQQTIEHYIQEYNFPILIHGHTHRPARHRWYHKDQHYQRWVLSDWRHCAQWLLWDGTQLTPYLMDPLTNTSYQLDPAYTLQQK